MNLPRVAVCILNYNTRQWLEMFLPSVMATQYGNLEIVLIDNASKDDSVDFVRTHYPTVKIISLQTNTGYAGGYNNGLREVDADIFVLLNSDVEVTPDWINPVLACLQADETTVAAQPKIRSYRERSSFEYAGAAGGFIDALGYPFCKGRILHICEEDKGQYDEDCTEIFWASGAALFIKAKAFRELEGFDEDFFAHMEEIDLCWRLKNAGYKIRSCTGSVVYHVGGGTLSQGSSRKVFFNFRNGLLMIIKNMPGWELAWKLPTRILLDYLAAIVFITVGNFKGAWAIVKAHWAVFTRLPYWLKKRAATHKKVKVRDYTGILKGSIVWRFFIGGKRAYSDLVK